MANEQINVGTVANDNTGDPIRDAFVKVNNNSDLSDLSGLIDSNIVTPGLESTPTSVNLNGLTVFGDNIDFTIKANGTGQLIFETDTIRLDTKRTPASSKGVSGDTLGDITWDVNYFYICTVTWTDGVSDIWARTAITVATW